MSKIPLYNDRDEVMGYVLSTDLTAAMGEPKNINVHIHQLIGSLAVSSPTDEPEVIKNQVANLLKDVCNEANFK